MQIRELLKTIPLEFDLSPFTQNVFGLSEDSRNIKQGFLFFAIDGNKHKGSEFVQHAQNMGAIAVVTQDKLTTNLPQIVVNDVRETFALCCAQFYQKPSNSFYLCGITGTNGKTTTTYVLKNIWGETDVGLLGTIEVSYPGFHQTSNLTTLSSEALQKTFANMKEKSTTHVAMEVSSHALDQKRTLGCDFNSAVFTNLTQDHLDYHKTLENYFTCKTLLFTRDLNLSQKKNRLAVINVDATYGNQLEQILKKQKIPSVTYSCQHNKADYSFVNQTLNLQGSEFVLNAFGTHFHAKTNLIGKHNLANIVAGLAVGVHSGLNMNTILERLIHINVPGRLERVGSENIFIDYAHTPDALQQVLSNLQAMKPKNAKLILVFGCGGNRDKTKRAIMGKIATAQADVVVLTSDNPRFEDPLEIINDIKSGVTSDTPLYCEVDRKKAIEKALNLKSPCDIVLIAGKGHETTQVIQEQSVAFDDRKVTQSLL